ncbi:MAG: thioredoxin family protein [Bacteroidia bacterium]|nr:thioredoxin family protein [Bacteroidia bacterium]MCF8427862.1 thioredoxin family protein [Bacteroidia bacterium]MCF8446611.1 thioredoxin family protein [Bacteroidia bacterium]
MKNLFRHIPVLFLVILLPILGSNTKERIKLPQDFSLPNVDGTMVSLSDYKEAKGLILIFTCNHCPFAKLYPERLNALNSKYKSKGVPLIAISSTDSLLYEEDGFIQMVEKAKAEHFNYPYLHDRTQEVAKQFHAQKTPHAFVLWRVKGVWEIKYQGAIDDNGSEPEKVETPYVANAVEELLHNKKVSIPETKSIGCQIYFRD